MTGDFSKDDVARLFARSVIRGVALRKGFLNIVTPPENSYEIDVVAQKWAWEFKYPNGATSEDLYVPAGQPVKLIMSSRDVLHSLYIKDFRVKQDVIPGRYSYLWFQANEPTLNEDFHWLFCTEYCGFGHSNMNRKVFVLPEDDFAEWAGSCATA